jgi:tetratricopeptide (TPR) repeat protein
LHELARVHGELGAHEAALEATRSLVEASPDDHDALEELALGSEGDDLLALEARLAQLVEDPALAATHQLRVAELVESVDPAQALEAYRAALARDPDSISGTRGFTRVARIVAAPEALREAATREARVTGDLGLATELLLRSADLQRKAGALEEAARDLETAIELAPESVRVADHLTHVLLEMGDHPRLVEQLVRAADSSAPLDRKAELHVAIAELQVERQGNLAAGIASLGRALKAVPDSVSALALLSASLELAERWSEAADTLKKLVRHTKDDETLVDAHLALASISDDRVGDPHEARKSLTFVLERDPSNTEALGRLGRISAREGRREEAATLAARLVDAAGTPEERAEALVEMAGIERARGEKGSAAKALHEALVILGPATGAGEAYRTLIDERVPEASWDEYLGALLRHRDLARRNGAPLTDAYLELARTFGDHMNRPDRALATLKEATEELPSDPEVSLALAGHFHRARAYDKAIAEVRRLLATTILVPDSWRQLAASLEASGDRDEAAAALQALPVIGAGTAEETVSIHARAARTARARAGLLGDAGFRELHVNAAHDSAAAPLVVALSETFKKLYPGDLGRYNVSKRDRVSSRAEHPMRGVADQVAHITGVSDFDLYIHDERAREVAIELFSTPALMVPRWATDLSQASLVFLLARPLAHISRDMAVFGRVPHDEVPLLLASACQSVAPGFGENVLGREEIEVVASQIARATPRRSRRAVEEAATRYASSPPADPLAWTRDIELTAYRAALLVTDDLGPSLEILERVRGDKIGPPNFATDLVRFWVSHTAVRFRRAM